MLQILFSLKLKPFDQKIMKIERNHIFLLREKPAPNYKIQAL
jgi:hypothetical protein